MTEAPSALAARHALATAGVGFVAASQALLWNRVIGAASEGRPAVLAGVLGVVLAGLGFGAVFGLPLRLRLGVSAARFTAAMVALSSAVTYLGAAAGAALMVGDAAVGRASLFAAAGCSALMFGSLLPPLCGDSVPGRERAGDRVIASFLFGAAAAPLLTGQVLLGVESLDRVILVIAIAGFVLSRAIWLSAPERASRTGVTVLALAALAALLAHDGLFDALVPRLHFGPRTRDEGYRVLVQGRVGMVGVTRDGRLLGDGLYEGSLSLKPTASGTLASGAYMVPALHRAPRRILQLGLGSGAWTRLLAGLRGVDSLTVVEPNAAYLDVIWRHPELAVVLDDSRVRLHLDDPRRWLSLHPAHRFDVIVVLAPRHWRGGSTRMLSAEFLGTLKAHLAEGGVAFGHTSGSLDALYTAAGVWRHVLRVGDFAAASDAPFDTSAEERRAAMRLFAAAVGVTAGRAEEVEPTLDSLLTRVSGDLAPALRRANDLWNITDDNLATEFKTAGAGAWWRALPRRIWRPDRAWPTILF